MTTHADVMAKIDDLEEAVRGAAFRTWVWQTLFWAALGIAIVGWTR